jgi:PleD family two-component response regulator
MDKIHALIVDDDRDTAHFFRTILSLVGFECDIVYSAKAALANLAASEPDIVLLDMRLGLDVSGTEILYQIRSNPRLDKTRVVVVTAYPSMAEPVDSLADLVLIKPIEIDQLKSLVSRLSTVEQKPYLFRDPVTNLYSYNFFLTRLEHAFERQKRRPDFLFATMVIVVGAEAQDGEPLQEEDREQLMKVAAERLVGSFRPTDTIARMDHERIIALFEDLKQAADVDVILRRMRQLLAINVELNGRMLRLSHSLGAVLNEPRFKSPEEILEEATQAARALAK